MKHRDLQDHSGIPGTDTPDTASKGPRAWGRKRRLRLSLFAAAAVFLCFLETGKLWWSSLEAEAHSIPEYERVSLTPVLEKISSREQRGKQAQTGLEAADYRLLFQQTGLGKTAVDYLVAQGRQNELIVWQERFFVPVEVECSPNTILTREECIVGSGSTDNPIPYVEKGDILVTFNCHALGWRNGHVGIVVDAEEKLTLEASRLGTKSKVVSMERWGNCPSFAVLRLKGVPGEERAAIADYARENLVGLPYHLEAGILEQVKTWINTADPSGVKALESAGTHCAHLTWYAYHHFGYDLDSDGGLVVTPRDIFESGLLEVVQVYGMSTGKF